MRILPKNEKIAFFFFLFILFALPISLMAFSDDSVRITNVNVIKPNKVHVGNRLKIEGSVQNLGTTGRSFDVSLVVNGTIQQPRKLFISSYQALNVSFFWTPARNGKYFLYFRVYISPFSFVEGNPITLHVDSIAGHRRYTMALYHFNIQYVPGSTAIENRIVEEAFYPLLRQYYHHSTWRCNIELSGYMLEVLHQRYPPILALLKDLVSEGKVELIVSHYSDQFLVAYPKIDMVKSIEISDGILDALDLVRSGVFFAQESQWTPGYASLLNAYDYDTVVVFSDPWHYYLNRQIETHSPLFYLEDNSTQTMNAEDRQINVLLRTKPGIIDGIEFCWAWAADGECATTNVYDNDFRYDSSQAHNHEKKLKKFETEGYNFVFISEFVAMLHEMNIEREKIPKIPEATKHTDRSEGIWRWMGNNCAFYEDDAFVMADTYRARQKVLVAETLLEITRSRSIDVSREERTLLDIWKKILLAEVSDSTGWTPLEIEVKESIRLAESALKLLDDMISELKIKLGYQNIPIEINPSKKTILKASSVTEPEAASIPHLNLKIKGGTSQISYTKGTYGTTITINVFLRESGAIEIIFPAKGHIMYSPSLAEDRLITFNPSDIQENPYLPLSNGLVIINGSKAIIKHCAVRHMALYWDRGNCIIFKENGVSGNLTYTFTFIDDTFYFNFIENTFYFGSVEAANSINVYPSLIV